MPKLPHMTTRFGLLGRKLGHSWSPKIHAQLGTSPYSLIELEPEQLDAFLHTGGWQGLNVTIPYKLDAARLADTSSEAVTRLGAANTLAKLPDGRIGAHNTDLAGFSALLEHFCQSELGLTSARELVAAHKVLVLGTGGASKAVRASLEDAGAHVVCISRQGEDNYETLTARHADAVLVVNTTPVGMFPQVAPSPLSADKLKSLPSLRGVIDIIYNPQRTALVETARQLGIPATGGLLMLVAQAARSAEIFTNHDLSVSPEEVSRITQALARENSNIALIGMPGSGKTSAGRLLARLLGRPFVDLDDACTTACGMNPAAYIELHGEDAFREVESEQVAAYGKQNGLVIACGGGVVVREKNWLPLHQNSVVVMLNRPLEELSSAGRPLSQRKGVVQLAAERMDLYRSWADIEFCTTGSAQGDAEVLAQQLGF